MFNRDAFGSFSLQYAVATKSWYHRLFLALLGMCEVNALNAYRAEVGEMERYKWWAHMSDALIHNPYLGESSHDDSEVPAPAFECGNQVYAGTNQACWQCRAQQKWRCACGVSCCRAGDNQKEGAKRY